MVSTDRQTLVKALEAVLAGRRSIRRYQPDPIPEADIRRLIWAAGVAPSAGNQQMWHFLVVRSPKVQDALKQAIQDTAAEMLTWPEVKANPVYEGRVKAMPNNSQVNSGAPVTIAVLTQPIDHPLDTGLLPERGLTFEEIYHLRGDPARQSLGAAIQNLLLMAHALGYGTVWMTGPMYASPRLSRILNVKAPWRLIALILLGVPAESPGPRPRRPVEENLTFID